jgi:hypothetical protein
VRDFNFFSYLSTVQKKPTKNSRSISYYLQTL